MEFEKLSLIEIVDLIATKKVTSQQVTKYFIDRAKAFEKFNAVLEVFDDAIEQAKIMDEKIENGFKGKLAGVPVIIKDNILCKGKKATCASKFLENYVAQYSSTVVDKMLKEGAVIIGRANMDEFAMGGSTENSAYGACHNAINFDYVAGGSSGGSAVAVALGLAPVSLGTDTGGSVRQPSAFNGVVGLKPTYGRISRYGVVAYASSLEQVGPITKNVKDSAYMLEILAGESEHDETSLSAKTESYARQVTGEIKGMKIGRLKEIDALVKGLEIEKPYLKVFEQLKAEGIEFVEVSIPNFAKTLPCYYIIASAEAASNLGRFDGVKYTKRAADAKDIDEIYLKSRSQGFGKEVKRRIMLGNFVLSSGYFDAYYNKAKKLQQKLKDEAALAYKACDVIVYPVAPGGAFKIGEKISDPVTMYKEDLFTILANILGLPSISIPVGKNDKGMPLALQVMGNALQEGKVFNIAQAISDLSEKQLKKEGKTHGRI